MFLSNKLALVLLGTIAMVAALPTTNGMTERQVICNGPPGGE